MRGHPVVQGPKARTVPQPPNEKGTASGAPQAVSRIDQLWRRLTSATPPSASRLSARLAGSGTAEAASFTV